MCYLSRAADCLLFSPRERWRVLSDRWRAEAKMIWELDGSQIQFKSNLLKPQPECKACQRPRSNSWALYPFACLDISVSERERGKKKRLVFFDLCHNMLRGISDMPRLKPHTHRQHGPLDILCWFPGESVLLHSCALVSVLEELAQLIINKMHVTNNQSYPFIINTCYSPYHSALQCLKLGARQRSPHCRTTTSSITSSITVVMEVISRVGSGWEQAAGRGLLPSYQSVFNCQEIIITECKLRLMRR